MPDRSRIPSGFSVCSIRDSFVLVRAPASAASYRPRGKHHSEMVMLEQFAPVAGGHDMLFMETLHEVQVNNCHRDYAQRNAMRSLSCCAAAKSESKVREPPVSIVASLDVAEQECSQSDSTASEAGCNRSQADENAPAHTPYYGQWFAAHPKWKGGGTCLRYRRRSGVRRPT